MSHAVCSRYTDGPARKHKRDDAAAFPYPELRTKVHLLAATMLKPNPPLDFARWIVWEDDGLIAIDKPSGVLSQGGEGGEGINVVDLARGYLGRTSIGVLHRLDRNVSGLVLVSKHAGAARVMSALIARGELTRIYIAVCFGNPRADSLQFDAFLAKDAARNEVRAATQSALDAMSPSEQSAYRPALTEAHVERRVRPPLGPCAILTLRPITGRSHQLRVHLAHAGLPIVGDPKYGVSAHALHRPLLHARRLEFVDPRTRKPVQLEAKVPWDDAFVAALEPPRPPAPHRNAGSVSKRFRPNTRRER